MALENGIKIVGEKQILEIIDESYRINEKIGVLVRNKRIRKILKEAGGVEKGDIVRIPGELIDESLENTPKEFSMYDRTGGSIVIKKGNTFLGTMSDSVRILDPDSRTIRAVTEDDLIQLTRISDSLDDIDFVGLQAIPHGENALLSQLGAFKAIMKNTIKPLVLNPLDEHLNKVWVELDRILKEDKNDDGYHTLAILIPTVSPLCLDDVNLKKVLSAAGSGIPILLAPSPISGLNSPFSVAGSLVQSLSECFFLLTVIQAVKRANPVFFCGAPASMDLATGSVSYASPEHLLMVMAFAEIANHLGLPSYIPMVHPDSNKLDFQAGAEMMMGFTAVLSCRPTLLTGLGSLGKTAIASREKILIDLEFYRIANRFYEGIEIDDRRKAFKSISSARENKTFLTDDLTMSLLREGEHYAPKLLNREVWDKASADIYGRARQEAHNILSDHNNRVGDRLALIIDEFFKDKKKELLKRNIKR